MPVLAHKLITFAGGQITATLAQRSDQPKVITGLALISNLLVTKHGTLFTRPGTLYIASTRNDNVYALLREWVYNDEQSYCMEYGYDPLYEDGTGTVVGHAYIRYFTAGAQLVMPAATAFSGATIYLVGDVVSYLGSNYYCKVRMTTAAAGKEPDAAAGVGEFYWYRMADNPLVVGGSILETPLPYSAAQIIDLYFKQSADVMWITHPDAAPKILQRRGHTDWLIDHAPAGVTITPPTIVSVAGSPASGPGVPARYMVTVTLGKKDNYKESLPGLGTAAIGTGSATAGGPNEVTVSFPAGHGLVTGDWVRITEVQELVYAGFSVFRAAIENGVFRVTVTSPTVFSLDETAGLAVQAGIGITFGKAFLEDLTTTNPPTIANPNIVAWTAPPGVLGIKQYNIYRDDNGTFSYVGKTSLTVYTDDGTVEPDPTITPPQWNPQFMLDNKKPAVTGFYKGRKWFGRSNSQPQTLWASVQGDLHNHTSHSPPLPTDAMELTIPTAGNEVRNLLEIGPAFMVITRGAKHLIEGNADGGISATDLPNLSWSSFGGCNRLPPVFVQESALYIEQRNVVVRDLREETDGVRGRDLTLFASDLFGPGCGCEHVDWAYAEIPHSIAWLVRADGNLLGLTYIREQEIAGWHQHPTLGKWRSVATVPESNTDAVYLIAQREIGGVSKRFVERMTSPCEECPA